MKIRLLLEHGIGSVIWLYDNDGDLATYEYSDGCFANLLPKELENNEHIKYINEWICNEYHKLYFNENMNFKYDECISGNIHFATTLLQEEFWLQIQKLRHIVFDELRLQDKYEIEDLLPKSLDECENC